MFPFDDFSKNKFEPPGTRVLPGLRDHYSDFRCVREKQLHPRLVKLGIPRGGFHAARHGATECPDRRRRYARCGAEGTAAQ
jgi:hypothetical protein